MKNFFFSKLSFVFMLIAIVCLSASIVYSQQTPSGDKFAYFSQMWNMSNLYYGTITYGQTGFSGLGGQLDTAASGGAITLTSSRPTTNAAQTADSGWTAAPITGFGRIKFTVDVYKAGSTTATVTATPYSSSDHIIWTTIPGVTTSTLVATSLTVPVTVAIDIADKSDRFYKVLLTGDGTNAYSGQAWYYFQAKQEIVR